MMNFESIGQIPLRNTATLTGMIVSFARRFIHFSPVFAVIRNPTTFPGWTIFAVNILGLPKTHTFAATKIVFIDKCVLASKFLTAPFTIEYFATPTQKRMTAFIATSNLCGFFQISFQTIWFYCKKLSTHGALERWGGGVLSAIYVMTNAIAKPKTRRIMLGPAGLPLQIFSTCGALNGYER